MTNKEITKSYDGFKGRKRKRRNRGRGRETFPFSGPSESSESRWRKGGGGSQPKQGKVTGARTKEMLSGARKDSFPKYLGRWLLVGGEALPRGPPARKHEGKG